MVLSNTKLKKKKREEAIAMAALAPPPDSNATPSSADIVLGDSPAVLSAKKKRPKAKKASGDGENGTVVAVPADGDNGIANATPEVVPEDSAPQDEGVKPKKKRKNAPEVEVSEDTPKDAERAGKKLPSSDGRDAGVSEVNGEGAISESNPGQGEEVPKTKMRKKPRWEVDENGKRIRPKKVAGEDEDFSECPKAFTSSDKGTVKDDATNGDAAAAAPASDGDRIHQGDEPWLQSKRSKKKKKLLDKWGKKIDNAAVADEQPANEEVPQSGSSTENVDPKKVMVGGMPYYITEDDIHEFFKECGTIAELDCMTFADTGKFKGIAFITFRTEEAAKRALALDGADMGGRFLKIEICKIKPREPAKKDVYQEPPKKYEGCLSAYIGNLSWDITEKELRKFFKGCKIDAIRFATNKETGEFRGFGHVDFADDESLEAAMKLDQMPVLDRPLKIAYSVPPKNKPVDVQPGQSGAKKKGCFTCGEEGHMSYNCPKKDLTQ